MTQIDSRQRWQPPVDAPHPVAANDVAANDSGPSALRVAYIMSRFPKLTETFVMNEILAMKREVEAVAIYPLMKERAEVVHEEAAALAGEAHYTPFVSAAIVRANLRALWRQPRVYWRTLRDVVRETWGNRRFLLAELALFPKAVYLAARFQAQGIDHVHAHFATHPAAAAFIIHRFSGIPYSFTGHGSDLHRFQEMLCLKVRAAAFVVAISEYNRRFIMAHCGDDVGQKIRVVHCGVDLQAFGRDRLESKEQKPPSSHNGLAAASDLRTPSANGTDPAVVLCIGTLHEVKGQRYLLEALAQLKRDGLEMACHFVGDGPDREMLETLAAQLGLTEQVTFFGLRSRRQVMAHLQAAGMLVTPSVPSSDGRREGIPVVLIEAMASGVPVIASRLSGIPELVRDGVTGLLAEPGDAADLATAIRQLHEDGALAQRLSAQARAYVEAEFDLQRNAATLAQLFAEATP